jgi:OOP family OmpA-OmpF porin
MKPLFLRKLVFVAIIASVFLVGSSVAGTSIRQSLFTEADKILQEVKEKEADLYSPKAFANGMKYYQKADKNLKKGSKNVESIQKDLEKATGYFKGAIRNTELAAVVFAKTMAARKDAIKADALKHDLEKWNKAEDLFKTGATTLEDGNSKSAKAKGIEAEMLYRGAELKGIQTKYLQTAWALIRKADEAGGAKHAPSTLKKACDLADKSALLITKHRYDTTKAASLAKQAEYNASHALYLTQLISDWLKTNKPFESILLEAEAPIEKIAKSLDLEAKFDKGRGIPTQQIVEVTSELIGKNKELEIANQNKDVSIAELQARFGETDSMNKELKAQAKKQRLRKQKLVRISKSFSKQEGSVLMKGEDVIIRLYGLNFPQGQATIQPKFFSLLTKVKRVFDKFEGCNVIIEGHTDSLGGDDVNHKLSNERAEAVKHYFLADGAIASERIKSVGYGEASPVASNKTASGREKNRRIDVIIKPVKQ